MVRNICGGMIVLFLVLGGESSAETAGRSLDLACLSCHKEQKIPSDLIYRRYLMRYSTADRIEEAMFAYLKDPLQSRSIMPPQFFLKFPMKPPLAISDAKMRAYIRDYIDRYDIRKRLSLER